LTAAFWVFECSLMLICLLASVGITQSSQQCQLLQHMLVLYGLSLSLTVHTAKAVSDAVWQGHIQRTKEGEIFVVGNPDQTLHCKLRQNGRWFYVMRHYFNSFFACFCPASVWGQRMACRLATRFTRSHLMPKTSKTFLCLVLGTTSDWKVLSTAQSLLSTFHFWWSTPF